MVTGMPLQDSLRFRFGKYRSIHNPLAKILINRTDFLANHASHQAVVPGRIKPWRKFCLPFIVKGDASFRVQQKSAGTDGTAGTGPGAGVTIVALT